ncbi:MAG: YraN family protein [Bacteroidetes bacterium]|nr:YraN family protein [Bacteroidota bacterium]
MAEHNELGTTGEKIAENFLKEKGYEILATNWRFGADEIDIIAKNNGFLVIVEVKTRSTNAFGEPEIAVTKQKQRFLIRASQQYIIQKDINEECRFDIISIIIKNAKTTIHHIEDAFYPSISY